MPSLRFEIDAAIPLPDGASTDPLKALAELPADVRARATALLDAIRAVLPDAQPLGLHEPVRASVHVCQNSPSGSTGPCSEVLNLTQEVV